MQEDPPLIIEGPEQSKVDPTLADAGIPPAVGVQSWCVFRASRTVPEMTDIKGWTYHHHVDMACWKGRLYVGWNSCEKDEDVWPSRELYSTSIDGVNWDPPREMFPQGVSTALRMYFYLAPNGRMLMIAGLRADVDDTSEERKGGIVVRELRADHTLGEVHVLQFSAQSPSLGTPQEGPGGSRTAETPLPPNTRGGEEGTPQLAWFDESSDDQFTAACRALLADRVYLEQQDRGRLLGPRRMKWHDASAWPGGKVPGDNEKWVSGKAFSFLKRPDGVILAVSKMGFTTISADNGETWDQPLVPPTLITGKAKVWAQQTADGRFVLVYNPSKRQRFPLIVVSGEDGIHFRDMRIVQGELPIQRYEGRFRSIGPQYIRGISHWSDDGSRAGDHAMWLVYSMNKEDIWVSHVPLPVKADATTMQEPWNTYCPKWAKIEVRGDEVRLENRDPYDYARAVRMFPVSKRVKASFDVRADPSDVGSLEIELMAGFGSARPVRITIRPGGEIFAIDAKIGLHSADEKLSFQIDADASDATFSVTLNGKRVAGGVRFAETASELSRLSFRTGPFRGIGGTNPVPVGSDRPTPAARSVISGVRLEH